VKAEDSKMTPGRRLPILQAVDLPSRDQTAGLAGRREPGAAVAPFIRRQTIAGQGIEAIGACGPRGLAPALLT
jgi:hypothetical protein